MRIAVIGAGISGLSAAKLLQDEGYTVTVFEKESSLGGHVQSLQTPVPSAKAPTLVELGVVMLDPVNIHPKVAQLAASLNVDMKKLEEIDKFIEDINIAGSKFHAEGKVLCYHNHALEFQKVQNEIILERIYKNTDSRFIQGEPDIYWIQKGGQNPLMWCKKLDQRMPLLHLKDFIMINDQESFFAEVGLGNLDIKNIVKTATDSGCKWFIVEQDECNGDPFDSLQISYNNLVKYAVT